MKILFLNLFSTTSFTAIYIDYLNYANNIVLGYLYPGAIVTRTDYSCRFPCKRTIDGSSEEPVIAPRMLQSSQLDVLQVARKKIVENQQRHPNVKRNNRTIAFDLADTLEILAIGFVQHSFDRFC